MQLCDQVTIVIAMTAYTRKHITPLRSAWPSRLNARLTDKLLRCCPNQFDVVNYYSLPVGARSLLSIRRAIFQAPCSRLTMNTDFPSSSSDSPPAFGVAVSA